MPEPPHRTTGVIFSMLVMILEIGLYIYLFSRSRAMGALVAYGLFILSLLLGLPYFPFGLLILSSEVFDP